MMKRLIGITLLAASSVGHMAIAQDKPTATPGAAEEVRVVKKPGSLGVGETITTRGTITAVDQAARLMTVQRANGEVVVVQVGKRVKNFDQIKAGDQIVYRVGEAVLLELKKKGDGIRERTETEGAGVAKPGEKPGVVVARQVQVVADVTAVDKKKGKITLRGVNETRTLKVKDPKVLSQVKVGDQVEITYLEGEALSVEAAK
jgi:Cu/Ag efflux protein CusF